MPPHSPHTHPHTPPTHTHTADDAELLAQAIADDESDDDDDDNAVTAI